MGKALLNLVLVFGAFIWLGIGGWINVAVPLGPVGVIAVIMTFTAPALSSIGRRIGMMFAKRHPTTQQT